MNLDISLPATRLFSVGPVHVTNGMLTAFVITAVLCGTAVWARRRMGVVPSKFQAALELPFGFVRDQLASAFESREKGDRFLPLVMTLLLFIAVSNQFSLVPLVDSMVLGDSHVFRLPTSDLSQTIGLAIMIMAIAWYLALRISPLRQFGNFIKIGPLIKARSIKSFLGALVGFLLGFMDIIGEVAKYVALACRLFGNVFAGEVMVAVIAGLSAYTRFIVPIPFYVLSIFSGFVQSLVFVLLTIQFIAMTVKGVSEEPSEMEADSGVSPAAVL